MYKKNLDGQNGNSSDKELIDISSDDEQNKSEATSSRQVDELKECTSIEELKDSKENITAKESKNSEELKQTTESKDTNKDSKKSSLFSTSASNSPKPSRLEVDSPLPKAVSLYLLLVIYYSLSVPELEYFLFSYSSIEPKFLYNLQS